MLTLVIAGLLTGLSLIVAIGAQNAYVLRQGILRSHVWAIVVVCAASDLILIAAGVSGVGTVVGIAPLALELVRCLGVGFLLFYAAGSLRRAVGPSGVATSPGAHETRRRAVGRALTLTWLNPHVYLDAVLIGSLAATHERHAAGTWWFAGGAGLASVLWFSALGFGAHAIAPLLATPRTWQALDVLIALTMVAGAVRLTYT
jgi:L-lysine exporter family protein LysE/ArgO